MIRHLAPRPATYSLAQLRAATVTRFPAVVDVNTVDADVPSLAAYFENGPTDATVTAWRADVAAHVPQHPTPEEVVLTAQTNEQALLALADAGLAQLQAIIDAADPAAGTLTTAQLSTAVRTLTSAVKTEARIQRRIIRLAIGKLDSTD